MKGLIRCRTPVNEMLVNEDDYYIQNGESAK